MTIPTAESRPDDRAPAYVLFRRLGKKVLRPGGAALTAELLSRVEVTGGDVIELGPGRGATARTILRRRPGSYLGVDTDPGAGLPGERLVVASAADTGLPSGSADAVVGEALLSMQSDDVKRRIITETARLLRPGGFYALHELGLTPDDLSASRRDAVRRSLAQATHVNARPLTVPEWSALLRECGLVTEWVGTAPMALLRPARVVADEGLPGALRFVGNVVTNPVARRRVLAMRHVFAENRDVLTGVAIIARRD
jgi:SAM-dependent methyltransferase